MTNGANPRDKSFIMQVNKTSLKGNCNSRSTNNKNNIMINVFCLSDRSFGFYYYFSHNIPFDVYVEKLEAYTDKKFCSSVIAMDG